MPSLDETLPQFLAEVGIKAALGETHSVALGDQKDDGLAAELRYEPYSLEKLVPTEELLKPLRRYFGTDSVPQKPSGRQGARIQQVLFGRRATVILSLADGDTHATGFLVANWDHEIFAGTP